jgi:hypothetical protein
LIVDIEIVRWAKRVAAGFEFDDVTLAFDRRRLPAVRRCGDRREKGDEEGAG